MKDKKQIATAVKPQVEEIKALLDVSEWTGTVTELATALKQAATRVQLSGPHLAVWLRRHEPSLWWDHGISVRFSRNGRRRLVHLARREPGILPITSACDGSSEIVTVTPEE